MWYSWRHFESIVAILLNPKSSKEIQISNFLFLFVLNFARKKKKMQAHLNTISDKLTAGLHLGRG